MKPHYSSLALALSVTLFHSLSFGQEWSRFRGKDGAGIGRISSLPAQFTKADYAWAVKLDGVGHSSPVLWGEKLFLTIVSEDGSRRSLQCFDGNTGEVLWTKSAEVEQHNLHKYNNFASSSPTADADRVYAVWGSGARTEAVAFDHAGEELWRREWPNFASDHGFGASPILVDGVLILHTDSVEAKKSYVMGLDPATGESLWELERATPEESEKHLTAYNTPTSVRLGDREVLVVLQTNDGWKGIDPKTGDVLWDFDGEYDQRSVGSIASGDGILFATFGSGGKGKQATALKPGASGSPEVLYSLGLADGLGYVPTPLIYQGNLYLWGDGGILTCRNAQTGEKIYEERVGGNFFSSPVVADGKILCASREGELVAIATGNEFKEVGRSALGSGMNATPAIANNRLYLRTDTHLICVEGR